MPDYEKLNIDPKQVIMYDYNMSRRII